MKRLLNSLVVSLILGVPFATEKEKAEKTDRGIKQEILRGSIRNYSGRCPCPYSRTEREGVVASGAPTVALVGHPHFAMRAMSPRRWWTSTGNDRRSGQRRNADIPNGMWRSGDVAASDRLTQAFQQALQVRHALPEFPDLDIHVFADVPHFRQDEAT